MTKEQLGKIKASIKVTCPELSAPELKEIFYLLGELVDSGKTPFEDFWKRWPKKVRKYAAERTWKTMSEKNKADAIAYIPTYLRIHSPYIQLAENYMHDKVWLDAEDTKQKTLDDLFTE